MTTIVVVRKGNQAALAADSLCVHGDGSTAVSLLQRVRDALASAGIELRPFA